MEWWIEWLWIWLACVAIALLLPAWLLRRVRSRWRWAGIVPLLLLATPVLAATGYALWYTHRPLPGEVDAQPLFEGVTYTRRVFRSDGVFVLHAVRVDLQAAGVGVFVTPPNGEGPADLSARTTSRFLEEFDLQVAVNAAFFYPWSPGDVLDDAYPLPGDPVHACGTHVSEGNVYGDRNPRYTAMNFMPDGTVTLGTVETAAQHAVAGLQVFLREGEVDAEPGRLAAPHDRSPRTAIAIDATGRHLMLFVVDGRQPNYSEGVSLGRLGRIIRDEFGGHTAINLDGGGSSTLVVEDATGAAKLLNSPIHRRVPPGQERAVANHLGVFAKRLEE